MNIITATELRTKTSKIIETLLNGGVIDIIHRSKIVGEIRPKKQNLKIMTKKSIQELKALAKKMNLPRLSYKERETKYRGILIKKYGQGLS